jgi:DNA-binding transcriptional MerR regulator
MNTRKTTVLALRETRRQLLSIEDLARAAGLHVALVRTMLDYGVIDPEPESAAQFLFRASAVERVRCVMRLRRDLGVNLAGAAVILEMKERMRSLRAELDRLRREVVNG